MTKISEEGFGMEKAIELGKALTQLQQTTQSFAPPEKPTDGMKGKGD